MKENLLEEFRWRGFLKDATEGAQEVITERKVTVYIGFDPTSDSLHIGNLVPIMGLVHAQRHGHTPIALVGGATGMIGDPSGKSKERNLLSTEILRQNLAGIEHQLRRFLDFESGTNTASVVNNADWIAPMSFIDFMREVGKNFPVGYMLSKESVKRRLENEGISFTEFSYMLLQAYDFYYLFQNNDCVLQMGGSDQWGNITAGIELIRRMAERKAHGIVYPLITTASGQKFGKTEEGAVWLDANKTSPYKFYQYWLNTDDADGLRYLKLFTLLEEAEVDELAALQAEAPHKRDVQKRLAAEVTSLVHGADEMEKAVRASKAMFGGQLTGMGAREIGEIFNEVPSTEIKRAEIDDQPLPVLDLLTRCEIAKSRGEARRLIQGGGMYLNNQRVEDFQANVAFGDAIEGAFIVLRKGAKKYHLVKVTG